MAVSPTPAAGTSAPLWLALGYGARAAARRRRLLVLPAVTVATGAFLLVVVLALMPAVRRQGATLGDAGGVGRAAVVVAIVVLLVGAFEVAIAATRSVSQRAREIGMLCSFGVPPRSVLAALLVEPIATAGVGAVVGAGLGAVAAPVTAAIGLVDAHPAPSPLRLAGAVALAAGVSLGAAALASALPCRRAVDRPPLDSLTA
jgi:ABC-type lipoprotein release transport system permease subunit